MKESFVIPGLLAILLILAQGCASPPKLESNTDPRIFQFNTLARASYQRGDYPDAIRFYIRALNRARSIDDPEEIATASFNVALCYMVVGNLDDVQGFLDEARIEYQRLGQEPIEIQVLEIKRDIRKGRWKAAEKKLSGALEKVGPRGRPIHLVQIHLLSSQVAIARGDMVDARLALSEAEKYFHKRLPLDLKAELMETRGKLYRLEKNYPAAVTSFEQQIELLKNASLYGEVLPAMENLAGAYRDNGQFAEAVEQYYRVTRSQVALKRWGDASESVEKGLSLSGESGVDPQIKKQLKRMKVQLNKRENI